MLINLCMSGFIIVYFSSSCDKVKSNINRGEIYKIKVILGFGIVCTLYGIAGILGFQVINERYKNHDWTAKYIRYRGISRLMLGIPWLILYLLIYNKDINRLVMCLLILLCGVPSFVYILINEQKYHNILKEEQDCHF